MHVSSKQNDLESLHSSVVHAIMSVLVSEDVHAHDVSNLSVVDVVDLRVVVGCVHDALVSNIIAEVLEQVSRCNQWQWFSSARN